jgi:hypothetical protein
MTDATTILEETHALFAAGRWESGNLLTPEGACAVGGLRLAADGQALDFRWRGPTLRAYRAARGPGRTEAYAEAVREFVMAADPGWYGELLVHDEEPTVMQCEHRIYELNDNLLGRVGVMVALEDALADLRKREQLLRAAVLAEAEAALEQEAVMA